MSAINWVAFGGILVDLVLISIVISNAFSDILLFKII